MLDTVPKAVRNGGAAAGFDVDIVGVATAAPANTITQAEIMERARAAYPQFVKKAGLFLNTGVSTRHFCQPKDWYYAPHSWEERTEAFQRHALDLLERVAVEAVAQAGLSLGEIDAIVSNTTTGLAVPSLDAMLMNRLPFLPHTERLPIFGVGCGGGVAGLSRATRVAQSMPGGNVLFFTVELCSLCLRINDPGIAMFVSAALFGDGAVAVVLRNTSGPGGDSSGSLGRVKAMGEHFWPDSEHIMGWDILNDGFGLVLSPDLPNLLEANLKPAFDAWLRREGLQMTDFDGFLFHAGASRVLDVSEAALGLPKDALDLSRGVLRDYGNMSSATVLFVLQRAIQQGRRGKHLLAALGPGFSAYFAAVDL